MTTRATLRFLLSTALITAALPSLARGPLAPAHDDATYETDDATYEIDDAPLAVVDGGTGWAPQIAHDDTAYPAEAARFAASDLAVATGPLPAGHDDASYGNDELNPPSRALARGVAARTATAAPVEQQ